MEVLKEERSFEGRAQGGDEWGAVCVAEMASDDKESPLGPEHGPPEALRPVPANQLAGTIFNRIFGAATPPPSSLHRTIKA